MRHVPAEEQGLKAERVQFWQRIVDATRTAACKVCDVLDAVIGAARAVVTAARALKRIFGCLRRTS